MRSLRGNVLMGAALWTLGLFALWAVAITLHTPIVRFMMVVQSPRSLGLAAMGIGIGAMLAGLSVVRAGLTPLHQLRRRLADVQKGAVRQVAGQYPAEVQPLVNDLNALLAHQEVAVSRALAKAGDLAHGLKTPLAVLWHEAERAAAAGQPELANAVTEQVERMRRQIEYHLAHARAAASGAGAGAQCAVAASAAGLARTLLRLHADRGLAIHVRVAADHRARCRREDLDEMLGNLLDNACKWAASRVELTSSSADDTLVIVVDDDGPGLAASLREAVLQRGVRADEAAPGSGFGLAIVREVAGLYDGSIALDASPAGGLRATLRLPAVPR
jgi:signal transduction histidine kinase